MDELDYRLYLHQAWMIAQLVDSLPAGDMLNAISQAEAIGPILDPTLYRDKASRMMEDRRLLESLANVKVVLASLERGLAGRII